MKSMGHTGSMSRAFRAAERESEALEDGVLVFMPGASDSRIGNIKKTIAWLQTQGVPTDCIIYKYQEISVPDEELSPCTVMDNQGQKWMDHILKVPLNMTKKKYVLHVMDGIEVQAVDLARMIKAMVDNDLVHAAPALYGKSQYPSMKPHLGFGRKVNIIEYHMDLFTRRNFACLQDLVVSNDTIDGERATDNHYGFYVADAMTFFCPGNLGVIDAMKMFKFAQGAYEHGPAEKQGREWMHQHGWGDLDSKLNYSVPFEPLKGDVLPGDPQCPVNPVCICAGAVTCFLD